MKWVLCFIASGMAARAVDFQKDIAPILTANCVPCHGARKALGGLRLDTAAGSRKGVVPAQPRRSKVYTAVMAGTMPPGAKLSPAELQKLRDWIAEGAAWPDGVVLGAASGKPDERASVEHLRKRIVAASKEIAAARMKAYKTEIAGTVVSYSMTPIPGGEFTMGTPASEKGRRPDEGPRHKVKLEPFWIGKYEVTWDEYRLFMFSRQAGETAGADPAVDAVSRPTRPYVEMSFGMGINGYPAISMTQHAANKYAQWLSARTGHFYRLPTEAEWEYACRAGTTAAYSFGDDESKLGEYAWYGRNSNGKYEKVGTKKPNPWGLYDMHGNVMEWTLDQYKPDYAEWTRAVTHAPWAKVTQPYPHAVRGGAWTDEADGCRCGARVASDPSWKMQDPQLPKSIWYHTDAQGLGFRLVRPLKVPPIEEMYRSWNNGVEKE